MPRRQRRERTSWSLSPAGEALLVLGLFIFAVGTRWPYLLRLPHFTDETVEVRWALEIWRGAIRPLTASDAYYGPLHAYLVAAALWLFGPSIVLPRALVLVFGAVTVVLTYLLGKALGGRAVGALAAALLATAPQHIIVNSHVAWQNATTPFYTTLCALALVRALRCLDVTGTTPAKDWGWWLVLAGFTYGLTLQTHPGTIVLAPALAATVLVSLRWQRRWAVLRSPWPYASVMAGLLAYSPVLIHNLRSGLAGVRRVQTRRDYAYEMDPSWESYRHNLANLGYELLRIISNPMRIPERPLHYLTSPYLLVMAGLALLGLVLLTRRRQVLPLFVLLSTLAIMPRFNHAYGVEGDRYLLTGRYVAYLLPLAGVAVATGALGLARLLASAAPRRWRDVARAVPVVLLVTLVLYPLQPLARYYEHESAKDPANATFLETVRVLDAARGPRTPIWLDGYFAKIDLRDGAEALDILDYLLILHGVPHRTVEDPGAELRQLAPSLDAADVEALPVIVMPRDRCWPLREQFPLERVSHTLILNELYRYYGVYRYAPRAQPPPRCLPAGAPQ